MLDESVGHGREIRHGKMDRWTAGRLPDADWRAGCRGHRDEGRSAQAGQAARCGGHRRAAERDRGDAGVAELLARELLARALDDEVARNQARHGVRHPPACAPTSVALQDGDNSRAWSKIILDAGAGMVTACTCVR